MNPPLVTCQHVSTLIANNVSITLLRSRVRQSLKLAKSIEDHLLKKA